MGTIHRGVEGHLRDYNHEVSLLAPFLQGFDVTWASRRRHYNTELSLYFLSPLSGSRDQFGFSSEVMLAINLGPTMQPRVVQAIEKCLGDEPAKGRVDQTLFFLISSDTNAETFLREYTSNNAQSRIPVLFKRESLTAESDSWFVRNVIADQLFSRDLFDYALPLDNDLLFFGRDAIVAEFIDASKKSENRGLFGLRKTGKTSVLKKLERLSKAAGNIVLYYDCKNPAIRNLRWDALLERVTNDILLTIQRPLPGNAKGAHVSDQFAAAIKLEPRKKTVSLIFDEIEYISPICKLDPHWHADFVPFWQTMWSTQSEQRRLSFFVAGVNPSIIEMDTVQGVQNPMFGIVRVAYLSGFSERELKMMLDHFGNRMGLQFSSDAARYLLERYGGHPLITRMACSAANTEISIRGVKRPVKVARHFLAETEEERERDIEFYSRHVISELRQFYPAEYEMLEMLASGNAADFTELSMEPEYTKHLREYGLITKQPGRRPGIKIPVLEKFVATERARRNGQSFPKYVVPKDSRTRWLRVRVGKILQDARDLEKIIGKSGLASLYGPNGIPEAERFFSLVPISDAPQFDHFINVCNRCLVEPLNEVGTARGIGDYLGRIIRSDYPELWYALERIRIYRHNSFHLALRQRSDEALQKFLDVDLGGRRVTQVEEVHFVLQQSVIDNLFIGIQCAIDRCG